MIIEVLNPTLAAQADTLIPATLVLIGIAVGGFSIEDAASVYRTGTRAEKYWTDEQKKERHNIPF